MAPPAALLAALLALAAEGAGCPPGGCDCPAPRGCTYPTEDPVEFVGEELRGGPGRGLLRRRAAGGGGEPAGARAGSSVFFLLNGAAQGLLARTGAGCFGSAAVAAAARLSPRAARVRAVSPMGRRVDGLASARAQGGFVHLLILGERFHWSPVRPGFVRRLHSEDLLEMVTLSVAPPVFLVRSSSGSVIGWDTQDLIQVAQPHLRDSPEKHYGKGMERHRTSQTAMIPNSGRSFRAQKLTQSLARLGSVSQVEGLQVVKYRRDEHYKKHQDFFVKGEEVEFDQWVEWLEQRLRENATLKDAIASADSRLHPASPSFSRALYEHLKAGRMLNEQDSAWVGDAVSDEDYKSRFRHVLKVAPLARLAKRAFASAVRTPELVMPEPPLGQNRLATLFVYLNSEFEGGATGFVSARMPPDPPPELVWSTYALPECQSGIQVRPKAGDAVLFYNLRADDAVEPLSQHVACPPHSGVKYGANVWIQTGEPSRLEL
ncbi:unnamed protein product [Prorocentrum cordatum]|uniref:Prolyl 4-hydroxylase alpha subunit domain-containing protein n=1 Tax=Prorocentrum cordatum TaxID=2364126 RepID=A0ABN9TVG0_9DINO|nr:unnamed protein product [Polarella glacialis]